MRGGTFPFPLEAYRLEIPGLIGVMGARGEPIVSQRPPFEEQDVEDYEDALDSDDEYEDDDLYDDDDVEYEDDDDFEEEGEEPGP